ncbi:hypothetical protein J6590_073124 [Homalodisca vitripennis]|nr:hypothetical protein J6590_073124 [Homalodisca vitripennis]
MNTSVSRREGSLGLQQAHLTDWHNLDYSQAIIVAHVGVARGSVQEPVWRLLNSIHTNGILSFVKYSHTSSLADQDFITQQLIKSHRRTAAPAEPEGEAYRAARMADYQSCFLFDCRKEQNNVGEHACEWGYLTVVALAVAGVL